MIALLPKDILTYIGHLIHYDLVQELNREYKSVITCGVRRFYSNPSMITVQITVFTFNQSIYPIKSTRANTANDRFMFNYRDLENGFDDLSTLFNIHHVHTIYRMPMRYRYSSHIDAKIK